MLKRRILYTTHPNDDTAQEIRDRKIGEILEGDEG